MKASTAATIPPRRHPIGSGIEGGIQWAIRCCGHRRALPVVAAIAFVVRGAHLVALRSTLWFDHLDLDPAYYDQWGRHIAAGHWSSARPFFVDAFYAYFLGALYTVFGHNLLVVRVAQLLLGVATVALVWLLGDTVGGPAVATVAALIQATYGPTILAELEIDKTAIATCCLVAALVVALRATPRWWPASGALLGVGALCRTNAVLLALPVLFVVLRADGRWYLRRAAAFAMGLVVVLAPVILHNQSTGGGWTLTTSAGQNLYIGNNPHNTGGSYGSLPFVRATPKFEEIDFAAEAEAGAGRPLSPSEVSNYWLSHTLQHVRDDPWFSARMLEQKVELVLNDYEVPDNQDYYVVSQFSPVLRLLPLSFGLLLPFAVLGAAAGLHDRRIRVLMSIVAVYLASIVAFFVVGRFRLPMIPVLSVLAALGARYVVREIVHPTIRRSAIIAGAALVAVAVVSFRPLAFHDRSVNTALAWRNLAVLQTTSGHTDEAIVSYGRALAIQPASAMLHAELGIVYAGTGVLDRAEAELLAATSEQPDNADVWKLLGSLYEQTGRPDAAIQAYEHAVDADPTDHDLLTHLDALEDHRP